MKILRAMPLALLLLCAGTAHTGQYKVKKCDATAAAEIAEAYRIATQHLGASLNSVSGLTDKQRDEMKRKWDKTNASCADDRAHCERENRVDGFAHGGLGNRVNICYYNMVALGLSLCDLAGVIVHEKAHADGMPKLKNHNDLDTLAEQQRDTTYQIGFAMEARCRAALGTGNRALRGQASLDLGRRCSKDSQCASDKCEKDVCVCKEDNDCPDKNQKCKKPLGGKNRCE